MLDIKFICENPELVKENIKRKFKDHKLPLVDEVIALYNEKKDANNRANELRANRNKISKQIGQWNLLELPISKMYLLEDKYNIRYYTFHQWIFSYR